MAEFKTKFATGRQDWETPASLFDPLNAEFGFTLDVCATAENSKCKHFFTVQGDALSMRWAGVCWMNPPFGSQGKWVRKAYLEAHLGATVVCLLPARTNTGWWHDYCLNGEVRFIRGRPIFKGAKHGLPQPLAIVIFRPSVVVGEVNSALIDRLHELFRRMGKDEDSRLTVNDQNTVMLAARALQ